MKVKIERKSFIDALAIGSQMAAKAKGLSILDNVKMMFKDNLATISSYDSEVAITKRVHVLEMESELTICVEPKALLSMLRSIKDDGLELEFENHICNVKHKKGVLTMPYDDADDFPIPHLDSEMAKFEVDSESLFNWLKEAKNFVHTSTLYPQMMGVYLYFEDNEFGVASTDMNVLYHNKCDYEYSGEKQDAVVSVKAIDALLPMINGTERVNVMNGSRNVVFRISDAMLVATKPEAKYPNFKIIIPKKHGVEVDVNKDDFIDSIKRTLLTADEKTSLLKFNISGMAIKTESDDMFNSKKAHDECFATCVGGEMIIGAKGTYVINILNCIESDELKMHFESERRPMVFFDSLNNNKIIVLMPCQV